MKFFQIFSVALLALVGYRLLSSRSYCFGQETSPGWLKIQEQLEAMQKEMEDEAKLNEDLRKKMEEEAKLNKDLRKKMEEEAKKMKLLEKKIDQNNVDFEELWEEMEKNEKKTNETIIAERNKTELEMKDLKCKSWPQRVRKNSNKN